MNGESEYGLLAVQRATFIALFCESRNQNTQIPIVVIYLPTARHATRQQVPTANQCYSTQPQCLTPTPQISLRSGFCPVKPVESVVGEA